MLRFRQRQNEIASRIYDSTVQRSRGIDLYARMGAPDTVEGRFELLTVHVLLSIERLNGLGDRGRAVGQDLFDLYLHNLDSALREMGVGDLAVGKRMKTLGQLFYGRGVAYRDALTSANPRDLEAVVTRTILAEEAGKSPVALARYLTNEAKRLNGVADVESLAEPVNAV